MALLLLAFPPHSFLMPLWPLLGLGIVGVIAFARAIDPPNTALKTPVSAIPGDGTNRLINKGLPLFAMLALLGAYDWWLGWLRNSDLSTPDFVTYTLMLTLVGLLIVALHESGHTVAGLLVGMKLRAFIVGPFQWRIRDGKWEFEFEPRRIVATSGATGVVPATSDFPRWASLCMLTAGVLTNTTTGLLALWVAPAGMPTLQLRGVFALFGAFSVVIAAINLVPFRTGDAYSDGAHIYQLFSKGPWSDFNRVVALAGASLVSPVRPRDYDVVAIHRAAEVIAQSRQGLLLRLLAYSYFLDHGDLGKAGEELALAAAIYNGSASDAPVEFVTSFVFGSAYIWRDAEVARRWWAHMEVKKPMRFNADYWLAHSALCWTEGNLNQANESLEKASKLAQELPKAGAYEFDRYCCSLLRHALDEIPVAT
jgi:hypothetical protein